MVLAIIIIVAICTVVYFVVDHIMMTKIMKESQDKIMNMLTRVYDVAEIFFIGLLTSIWGKNDDFDDEDFK